jgi:YHS domain-containing protein
MTTVIQKINKTTFGNLTLKGYDPVAYFTEGRAVEGNKQFTHDYAGATWRFVSSENRNLFAQDPERYMPQYGGYCAWGISQAKFFDGDPQVWKVLDGKLYVNYNKEIEKTWEQDAPGFIEKADRNWPTLEK